MPAPQPKRTIVNWIVDRNPFSLPKPPEWFLRQLALFDDQLVIIPSRYEYVYRLMRRRKLTAIVPNQKLAPDLDTSNSDFALAAEYKLVPVQTILPTAQWGETIFSWLRDRDIWTHGGATAAADALDAQDQAKRDQQQAKMLDELDQLSSSTYFAYKRRTGQTTFVNDPTRRTPLPLRQRPGSGTGGSSANGAKRGSGSPASANSSRIVIAAA